MADSKPDQVSEERQQLFCSELPPKVNSFGYWVWKKGPLKRSLPLLQMQMIFILGAIHMFHSGLKRFGVPMLISEILVRLLPLEFLLEKTSLQSEY